MMENNKLCPKCGKSSNINASFCGKCGKKFYQDKNTNNNQTNHGDNLSGNILGIMSLLFYYSTLLLLGDNYSTITGILPLIGIVVMIIGRITYPNNKLLKVAMWIIICTTAGLLTMFVLLVMACHEIVVTFS